MADNYISSATKRRSPWQIPASCSNLCETDTIIVSKPSLTSGAGRTLSDSLHTTANNVRIIHLQGRDLTDLGSATRSIAQSLLRDVSGLFTSNITAIASAPIVNLVFDLTDRRCPASLGGPRWTRWSGGGPQAGRVSDLVQRNVMRVEWARLTSRSDLTPPHNTSPDRPYTGSR